MGTKKISFVMKKNGDPVHDAKVDAVAASIQRDIIAHRKARDARVIAEFEGPGPGTKGIPARLAAAADDHLRGCACHGCKFPPKGSK